jgi:HlyD family secretion protein
MAEASLEKAESEFKKNDRLFKTRLISDTVFVEMRTAYDIARAQLTNSTHQIEMSRAQLARAEEDLAKTTIVSPINGTISRLNSQVGERVVGTATMAGTEVMTIADLDEMEARVDIGEIDVVLIKPGQKARLEVDAFKDRKFTGTVTEIANTAKGFGQMNMGGQSQEATKFEVKIRIQEKENFRPGMSVSTEIETRYRTNVLTVPLAAVTTRMPKDIGKTNSPSKTSGTASIASTANAADSPPATNALAATNATTATGTNSPSADKKSKDAPKPVEVVFVLDGDKVKQVPVKIGISDENYWEITQGLKEEQEIVSGGYKAVNRELEDGKKIRKGTPDKSDDKDKEKK